MSDQTRVQAQQIFAQAQRVHVGDGKTRVRANRADIGDMIVEPFELEQNDSEVRRARWNGHAGERFDRLTKREGVRHARVAGNSLGQFESLGERGGLEELFNAFVDEIHARFEIDDRFAFDAEAKMTGLDDAGVDGTDGDFINAFAFDAAKRIGLRRRRKNLARTIASFNSG